MYLKSGDLYQAWRKDGGPTLYPANKTPVTADILEYGLIFAFVILAFSFLILLPGYYGRKILFVSLRISVGVFVASSIILCNFGQDWETSSVKATTQYRAGLRQEIQTHVGLHIGLRSINVTLKGDPKTVSFNNGTVNETINYNERFTWDNLGFVQGRGGFGPNAGQFNQEFRQAQLRGAPYPILWVSEYFTLDGEGIRWGRYYRQAGFYAHIMMWTAFPLWILAMICSCIMVTYGGFLSILTGLVLGSANIIYACVRNPTELAIPINSEAILNLSWGWCFILNAFTACLCVVIGCVILLMHRLYYDKLADVLNLEVVNDLDDLYTETEIVYRRKTMRRLTVVTIAHNRVAPSSTLELIPQSSSPEFYNSPPQTHMVPMHRFQKNSPIRTKIIRDQSVKNVPSTSSTLPGQIDIDDLE